MEDQTEDPPRLAQFLLRRVLAPRDIPYVLGDLAEEYHEYLASGRGRWWVRVWYWKQVGESIAPSVRQRLGGPNRPEGSPNRGDGIMGSLLQDIRHAFRGLRRSPGFTTVAILTLALGIGANMAMFSVVNGVILRPLPYDDPGRIVRLHQSFQDFPGSAVSVSPANFLDWERLNGVFEEMAAAAGFTRSMEGGSAPERVASLRVTPNFFHVLGVQAGLGRTILPDDDPEGGEPIIVLSHGLWMRFFGGDPSAIGKTVRYDGEVHTVIGVMPPDFSLFNAFNAFGAAERQAWVLNPFAYNPRSERTFRRLQVIARLKPDVSLEQARAEMESVASGLEAAYPEANEGIGIAVLPMRDSLVGEVARPLFLFFGAVGFVLLIACVNLANLLLSRGGSRQGEVAIRMALGAGRTRLVRQFLTETLVLFLLGGTVGIIVARLSIPSLVALSPPWIPRIEEVGIDVHVIAFTLSVSLLTGLAFGLVPAIRGAHAETSRSFGSKGTRSIAGPRSPHGVNLLVILEVALSLVLLIGAGLMLDSFARTQKVDGGFDDQDVLTMQVYLSQDRYAVPSGTVETGRELLLWVVRPERVQFVGELVDRLEDIPQVQAAAAINHLPKSGPMRCRPLRVEGQPEPPPDVFQCGYFRVITPSYFDVMGIPLLRGRRFDDRDTGQAPDVVIVSETVAQRYWPGEDPIGKRLITSDGWEDPMRPFEIVGIVGDVRSNFSLFPEPYLEMVYIPYTQQAPAYAEGQIGFGLTMYYTLKTSADLADLAPAMRQAVWDVDPDQPVTLMRTMEAAVAETLADLRFYTTLLTIFSALAITLAAIGVYGVMSTLVLRRTREIGIRMALGARAEDVLRLVGRRGVMLTAAGTVVGVAGALALTRLLSSWLYEVDPTDPSTFAVVPGFLVVVSLLACFIPARRATKVDPMATLRTE